MCWSVLCGLSTGERRVRDAVGVVAAAERVGAPLVVVDEVGDLDERAAVDTRVERAVVRVPLELDDGAILRRARADRTAAAAFHRKVAQVVA